jgi:hypothetical protein
MHILTTTILGNGAVPLNPGDRVQHVDALGQHGTYLGHRHGNTLVRWDYRASRAVDAEHAVDLIRLPS